MKADKYRTTKRFIFAFMFSYACGLLYFYHRNLLAVSLCHVLVGNYLGIVGYWDWMMTPLRFATAA